MVSTYFSRRSDPAVLLQLEVEYIRSSYSLLERCSAFVNRIMKSHAYLPSFGQISVSWDVPV